MNTVERIQEQVQSLPEPVQQEVLDFVEYLAHKLRREDTRWSEFSLKTALHGLEDETWPEYTKNDFKEQWK